MIKFLLSLVGVLFVSIGIGQNPIVLTDENLGESFTNYAELLEDKEHKLSIKDILSNKTLPFTPCQNKIEQIDFTSSTYWMKFSVQNQTQYNRFVTNISRTFIDEVIFYEVEGDSVLKKHIAGDAFTLKERTTKTVENLFYFLLQPNQKKDFVVKFKSDGEIIRIPLIINTPDGYFMSIRLRSFFLGVFYGSVLLISILYLLYYKGLRDKTLLYYSIYLLFVFMLQFTLDGFTYYYLFSEKLHFLEPYTVVVFASLAPYSFLIFVKNYLNIRQNYPEFCRYFKIAETLIIAVGISTFIPGKIHELSYLLVNFVSLITLLWVLFIVLFIKMNNERRYFFFSSAIFFLVISAVLFILTNVRILENEFLFKYSMKIGAAIEIFFLTLAMSQKLYELQRDKQLAQEKALKSLEEKNKLIDTQKEMLRAQVKERTQELETQKEQLAHQNREIIDSINYAKRLQDALIPSIEEVKKIIPNSFVLFKPKDIVSGDFYWIAQTKTSHDNTPKKQKTIITVADCTGHGVPGAFISVIGLNIFNQALKEKSINTPAETLDFLNKQFYNTVNKHKETQIGTVIRDGMDLAMCAIDKESLELEFSGAKNPVYIIRENELIEIKGDKQPIGFTEKENSFKLHKFQLKKGDILYLSTDGYADQFGGERGKKFKYKPFKELLLKIASLDMEQQRKILEDTFIKWKGNLEQLDDICIIGIRI